MRIDEPIIVASRSRLEIETAKHDGQEAAKEHFHASRAWEWIVQSHQTQKEHLAAVMAKHDPARIVDRTELTEKLLKDNDVFVLLGGDNHFTYCAQVVLSYLQQNGGEKYVLGATLDPHNSSGKLLGFTYQDLLRPITDYAVERWTTLEATVNGEMVTPAVCDYFIGEENRLDMSRQTATLNGKKAFEEKSSGILIATGAGSLEHSWYDNTLKTMRKKSTPFSKTAKEARAVLTENAGRHLLTLRPGDELIIDSYNDSCGIIAPDSHHEHGKDFMIGSQAYVRVGYGGLDVIVPRH